MKTVILILSAVLSGCAYNPYRMANYFPDTQTPSYTGSTVRSPQATTIVTRQGNYVIIPNYTTGQIQSVIGPGR
jgi:hypothetical protein